MAQIGPIGESGEGAGESGEGAGETVEPATGDALPVLTEAQRNRLEQQRQRALERRAARSQALASAAARTVAAAAAPAGARDSGGGFLLEEEPAPPKLRAPPPAPVAAPHARPRCALCGAAFAASFLWDTFDFPACDACRDDAGEHALLPRTDAKAEFLLRDADLDLREPPLRALLRRNPHAPRSAMRLYLRAQLAERAALVWGSEQALQEEHARREARRAAAAAAARARRLAALRRAVRPAPVRAAHAHRWAPERYDAALDAYSRACLDCPHVETYEKM